MLVQFARHGHDSRDICVFRKLFRDNFCFLDVGVVEAAGSNPVTQTKNRDSFESRFFFIYLAISSVFAINITGLFFPASRVEQAHFSPLTTCLTTYGDFCIIFGCCLIVSRR